MQNTTTLIFKNIPLGTYIPGNSFLHRLQARTKLLLVLWFLICMTIANQHIWHFTPYAAVVILIGTGMALSGISPRQLWQRMWLLLIFSVIGAVSTLLYPDTGSRPLHTFGPFAFPSAEVRPILIGFIMLLLLYMLVLFLPITEARSLRKQPWFRFVGIAIFFITSIVLADLSLVHVAYHSYIFGPIVITYESVWFLLNGVTFFLVLYALSLLLTMTTTPVALIEGLTLLLAPLRRLRLPVDEFALMALLALRFIPTLIDEVQQLMKAQISRGADLSHGTIRERLQSLSALFVPFIQGTFRRADEIANALEARGYQVEGRPTPLYEKSLQVLDYLVLGVVVLVSVGALLS